MSAREVYVAKSNEFMRLVAESIWADFGPAELRDDCGKWLEANV